MVNTQIIRAILSPFSLSWCRTAAIVDSFQEGQEVEVHFELRGREWTSPQGQVKYFNSLQAWKLVAEQEVAKPPSQDIQNSGMSVDVPEEKPGWLDSDAADDLPF
ncbi:MAG: hypothetical protein Ct9H300mP28_34050 [Pseudomonadota bacterium]|nr:MAG: hypothetical protein Ct9H300mP28_34050 [Pseudomonadota bacterium]